MVRTVRHALRTLWLLWRSDAGLQPAEWTPEVERDAIAISVLLGVSAVAAHAVQIQLDARLGHTSTSYVIGKGALCLLAASSLAWMPMVLRRRRTATPLALFWGAVTLTGASLDTAAGHDLVDVMWSLIPGYLAITMVGFFGGVRELAAWLLTYFVLSMPLVWMEGRGLRLQVALLGMVGSMGGYSAYLYRRSLRALLENQRLERERLRNCARVLPDPITDALSDEAELRALMQPRMREVAVVSLDIRDSTLLLQRIGPSAYVDTVQPLITQLYRQARRMEAFAKFEGDGLLVVFGAFDDRGVDADRVEVVLGYLQLARRSVAQLNQDHGERLGRTLRVGLGVASGEVVVGSVAGFEQEAIFDVVGEPVAYACRLEGLSKAVLAGQSHLRDVAVLTEALAQWIDEPTLLRPIHRSIAARNFEQRERLWEIDLDLLAGLNRRPRRASTVTGLDGRTPSGGVPHA